MIFNQFHICVHISTEGVRETDTGRDLLIERNWLMQLTKAGKSGVCRAGPQGRSSPDSILLES